MKLLTYSIIISLSFPSCTSLFNCKNDLILEVFNPSNLDKAILFYRECGATTNTSLQVSLESSEKNLDNSFVGNILSCQLKVGNIRLQSVEKTIKLYWENDSLLKISLDSNLIVFNQQARHENISIEYIELNTKPNQKINFKKLKSLYSKYSTSGVLPLRLQKQLCMPDSVGFFGFYNLIDSLTMKIIGEAIVFNPGHPNNWRYDNDEDILISLDYNEGEFLFFDHIQIGMRKSDLIKKLEAYSVIRTGRVIRTKIEDYHLEFYFNKETLSKIRVNFICE